ncbi:hypothetical protein [Glaciimonas soli]|uniref:Uncharacterized protein n=1 Tax=Glaciimonas soli TaxID=2590999 RepID=A0A843YUF9_9BURK|nr:hypothetical protein [Glaciimonas soli]MQR00961.1 hypothetical protein [Glaciimonas soli]
MQIDMTRPSKLYRYSERKWLERSLNFGEFRLRPASDYKNHETDHARHDDELIRVSKSPANTVTITVEGTGQQLKPIGEIVYQSEVGTNYLTICFSEIWDELLFQDFPGTDACLVIHDVETFAERFHAEAQSALLEWGGIDAPVVYGGDSPLGAVFSKPLPFILQKEWRFAWRPPVPIHHIEPITISIGSIANIAEIIERPRLEPHI